MRTLCVGWAFDCPPKADHFCSVGGYSTPFKPTQFKVGQRVRVDLGTGDYVRAGDNQPFFATVLAVEEEHVWVKRVDLSRANEGKENLQFGLFTFKFFRKRDIGGTAAAHKPTTVHEEAP